MRTECKYNRIRFLIMCLLFMGMGHWKWLRIESQDDSIECHYLCFSRYCSVNLCRECYFMLNEIVILKCCSRDVSYMRGSVEALSVMI
jgi:hypothetical protein